MQGPQGAQGPPGASSVEVITDPSPIPAFFTNLNRGLSAPVSEKSFASRLYSSDADYYYIGWATQDYSSEYQQGADIYRYRRVPGMIKTVTLAEPATIMITTDGGVAHAGETGNTLTAEIAVFVDGVRLPQGGVRRVSVPPSGGTQPVTGNWNMTVGVDLPAGQHQIEICARQTSNSINDAGFPEAMIIGGESANDDPRWRSSGVYRAPYKHLEPSLVITIPRQQ